MNVWFNPPTIIKRRFALLLAGLLTLFVALTTTLLFTNVSLAAPGINEKMSFQGRLLTSSGGLVPDGRYNMQFKVYQGGSGSAANNPDGTLEWTENYVNNNANQGVVVKNGYFSVDLGSRTPFGDSIDWNDDTLFLSINIAGSNAACTTFGTAPCTADGEMLPMKRLTSTPYAMNAGKVGGKSANELVQLGQGAQTDNSSSSSIFINKLGVGNLLQLQNMATDVFTIANSGDIIFGSSTNHSITNAASANDMAGTNLSLAAGAGGAGAGTTGGNLILTGGTGGGTNGDGGNIEIDAGAATGSGSGGTVSIGGANASSVIIGSTTTATAQTISIGSNNTSGSTSNVVIGAGGSASGGTTDIRAKDEVTISTNGSVRATFSGTEDTAYFGNGATSSMPTDFKIQGTNSSATAVDGGTLTVQGGSATVGDANGGDIIISGGSGSGSGTNGLVVLTTPTFSATTNDANCYTGGAPVPSSCTITGASVDGKSAIVTGFSAAGQTANLPNPTNTTAGRIIYVMAAASSEVFTLSANSGATTVTMRPNTTTTMMWNGDNWSTAGTASSTAIRDVYSSETGSANVAVGSNTDSSTSLLTLDGGASAPSISDPALLGSMYYDTTLGEVQCYEESGWGNCGASPDSFITLSPEYSNAVMNGADIGTITSDLCSDTLNVNDGSSGQPTICGTNETYNFYKWTSAEANAQTRSIYVTYQLPANFKEFVAGSTSLKGRTDSTNANVSYQVYRDDGDSGLVSCGTEIAVSTGAQTTWQQALADNTDDPANCNFEAGDSILFRINLSAHDDANAYVSNLNFTFSNN